MALSYVCELFMASCRYGALHGLFSVDFVWKEKKKSRCGVVMTTLIKFNVHDRSGRQCVTYSMLGAIEKYGSMIRTVMRVQIHIQIDSPFLKVSR